MTLEIIVFVLAILFGIIWFWRESRSNRLYRLANRITHAKRLQMKEDNRKGFVHKQPFLMRLVWITLVFVIAASVISFVTPINAFYIQYFASAIVGTLIGTYLASVLIFAQDSTKKENLEKVIRKGKEFVEEITDLEDEQEVENATEPTETKTAEPEVPKKSARDRLKDKGMIK
jgi:Na+/H+ antiporter NhaC